MMARTACGPSAGVQHYRCQGGREVICSVWAEAAHTSSVAAAVSMATAEQ